MKILGDDIHKTLESLFYLFSKEGIKNRIKKVLQEDHFVESPTDESPPDPDNLPDIDSI